jgi:4-diphosphocytidyl-2-C-methyl-D-erythritol kinase
MHISTYLDEVVVWTPAKVNLFLEVLGKRPDGYHDIATLMVAIRLYDTLVFRTAPELALRCSSAQLSSGPDNLVLRAAKLLQERTGCQRGASIRLIKRIPMAAGLAGGSADAAATLLGLNDLWKLGRSDAELANIGAEIGSDIPFFFDTPAAWCTGRGEIVAPAPLSIPLDFVLLCPAFGMPTAAVYKNVVVPPVPVSGNAIRAALGQADVDLIGKLLHNRLQTAAEGFDPRIAEYARMLAKVAPAPAGSLMSGSGSTLFALCRSPDEADRVAASLKTRTKAHDFRLIVTRSL